MGIAAALNFHDLAFAFKETPNRGRLSLLATLAGLYL
jgi:hypothetical protein